MLVALGALAGCSQPSTPTLAQQAAARAAAANAAAQQRLTLFHKLLAMKRPQLAIPIGQEILDKYPRTSAATAVAKVLPGVKTRAAAMAEKTRLANLWSYQVSPMAGGTQSTAAIDPSKPAGSKVELVLRRHSAWGTSTYLYDHAKGASFVCHGLCRIVMHFDGVEHVYRGYLPNGGEPAMFIKDYKGFVKRLAKAKVVDMDVAIKGSGKQTLVFETGGFVASKWLPLPKKK
ncbi:MAG TPA: hypothetical protein VF269_07415 [Rhodanobacteraceae bacterium]